MYKLLLSIQNLDIRSRKTIQTNWNIFWPVLTKRKTKFSTYISDFPDFSHDFHTSDLLLEAITPIRFTKFTFELLSHSLIVQLSRFPIASIREYTWRDKIQTKRKKQNSNLRNWMFFIWFSRFDVMLSAPCTCHTQHLVLLWVLFGSSNAYTYIYTYVQMSTFKNGTEQLTLLLCVVTFERNCQ